MINIRTIKKLADGDSLTLKNGKIKRYKSGYQVNTATVILDTPEKAIEWMKRLTRDYGKSCQIHFKNKEYYISLTEHAYTRRQAREIANEHFQGIIYDWHNMTHQAV